MSSSWYNFTVTKQIQQFNLPALHEEKGPTERDFRYTQQWIKNQPQVFLPSVLPRGNTNLNGSIPANVPLFSIDAFFYAIPFSEPEPPLAYYEAVINFKSFFGINFNYGYTAQATYSSQYDYTGEGPDMAVINICEAGSTTEQITLRMVYIPVGPYSDAPASASNFFLRITGA
jgi:hypothetical protein